MKIEWIEDDEFMENHDPGGRIMRAVRRQAGNEAVVAMVFCVLMDDGKACMTFEGDWSKIELLLNSATRAGEH